MSATDHHENPPEQRQLGLYPPPGSLPIFGPWGGKAAAVAAGWPEVANTPPDVEHLMTEAE